MTQTEKFVKAFYENVLRTEVELKVQYHGEKRYTIGLYDDSEEDEERVLICLAAYPNLFYAGRFLRVAFGGRNLERSNDEDED
jgi:hypothetical protein